MSLVLALTVALTFALGGATAITQERIVVHGAASGSHLRLSVNDPA